GGGGAFAGARGGGGGGGPLGGRPQRAAAFGRKEKLSPPVTDGCADELLAPAVVGRGVDQVDPAVEDRVQQPARVLVCYRRPSRQAPQLHGSISEDGHVRAGAP